MKKHIHPSATSLLYFLFLCFILSGCIGGNGSGGIKGILGGGTMSEKIIGKWQIDSNKFESPIKGLEEPKDDRYDHYKNRVIEYKKDSTAKWIDSKHPFTYKVEENDSTIITPKKKMKIVDISNRKMITKETYPNNSTWTTWFSAYSE